MIFDEPDYSTTLPYSMLPGDRLLSLSPLSRLKLSFLTPTTKYQLTIC
jgi:hypothetical protein